jgi:hypothetical protein
MVIGRGANKRSPEVLAKSHALDGYKASQVRSAQVAEGLSTR